MKRVLKFLFVIPVLMLLFLSSVIAQPSSSSGRHSARHTKSPPPGNGGTAPIGSGVLLLLTMAAGYGVKKIFDARNSFEDEVSS